MHKPTIHGKISKSSFFHHPLTDISLITMILFLFPYDLLFSSYMTVSVIRLKRYIHFEKRPFPFPYIRTLFTNSPTTNCFVFDESMPSSCTKLRQELRPLCYFGPYRKLTYCGGWSVYA